MRKNQGPQGTQVFSREEVDRLLDEAGSDEPAADGARIRGLSGSVSGEVFALPERGAVIGRGDSCLIRIDDASVSSEHARLVPDENGWRLVNLLSTNGTFVNEKKISSARVSDGDHIRFGRVEFRFHDASGSESHRAEGSSWKRWLPLALIVIAAAAGLAYWLL